MRAHAHTHAHTHMHTHMHTNTHMHTCTHTCTHTHTQSHTHAHTHARTHTHAGLLALGYYGGPAQVPVADFLRRTGELSAWELAADDGNSCRCAWVTTTITVIAWLIERRWGGGGGREGERFRNVHYGKA